MYSDIALLFFHFQKSNSLFNYETNYICALRKMEEDASNSSSTIDIQKINIQKGQHTVLLRKNEITRRYPQTLSENSKLLWILSAEEYFEFSKEISDSYTVKYGMNFLDFTPLVCLFVFLFFFVLLHSRIFDAIPYNLNSCTSLLGFHQVRFTIREDSK
jgi:hypothetical protein